MLKKARADLPPPGDLQAVLRTVAAQPVPPAPGWWDAFLALFPVPRFVPACVFGAACCALFSLWEAMDLWQALPWAQLLATASGGTP